MENDETQFRGRKNSITISEQDLKDLVECTVCLEIPNHTPIYQCPRHGSLKYISNFKKMLPARFYIFFDLANLVFFYCQIFFSVYFLEVRLVLKGTVKRSCTL